LKAAVALRYAFTGTRIGTHLIRSAAAEWTEAFECKRIERSVVGDGSEVVEVM
jgi:hypothetical protein